MWDWTAPWGWIFQQDYNVWCWGTLVRVPLDMWRSVDIQLHKKCYQYEHTHKWILPTLNFSANRCSPIPTIDNAVPDSHLALKGHNVTFNCLTGYEFDDGSSTHFIYCDGVNWNATKNKCHGLFFFLSIIILLHFVNQRKSQIFLRWRLIMYINHDSLDHLSLHCWGACTVCVRLYPTDSKLKISVILFLQW